jgi:hypothetical protein
VTEALVILAVYALLAYLAYMAGGVWLLTITVMAIAALTWAAK